VVHATRKIINGIDAKNIDRGLTQLCMVASKSHWPGDRQGLYHTNFELPVRGIWAPRKKI